MAAGLLAIHMVQLNSRALDGSEASFRTANTMLQLLEHFPADMPAEFQADLLRQLQQLVGRLHTLRSALARKLVPHAASSRVEILPQCKSMSTQPAADPAEGWQCREDGRVTLCVLAALNAFLTKQGLDVCNRAAELHQATQPLVLRLWRSARDGRTRDTLVQYLRIQSRLQVSLCMHVQTHQVCRGLQTSCNDSAASLQPVYQASHQTCSQAEEAAAMQGLQGHHQEIRQALVTDMDSSGHSWYAFSSWSCIIMHIVVAEMNSSERTCSCAGLPTWKQGRLPCWSSLLTCGSAATTRPALWRPRMTRRSAACQPSAQR